MQCRLFGGQGGCGPFNPPVTTQTITAVVHSPQGLSPADGPFTAFGTEDGQHDDGPFTIPWEQLPCACEDLTVSMKASDAYTAAAELRPAGDKLARFGGMVTWTLTCSGGAGQCSGEITLEPPKKSDIKLKAFSAVAYVPKVGKYKGKTLYKPGKKMPLTFTCGPTACGTSTQGHFFLQADSTDDLLPGERAGKKFSFRFVTSCGDTNTTELITIVFKANGDLDKKKSNLRK